MSQRQSSLRAASRNTEFEGNDHLIPEMCQEISAAVLSKFSFAHSFRKHPRRKTSKTVSTTFDDVNFQSVSARENDPSSDTSRLVKSGFVGAVSVTR